MRFLIFVRFRQFEDGFKWLQNLSASKVSLKYRNFGKRLSEVFVVVLDASLVFEHELKVASVAHNLESRTNCETLEE